MTSLLRKIFPLLVLAAAALIVSPGAQADRPKHHEVVQTFEPARNNGTPLVQVRFSNTVIGTFAIDTGEYESVITKDFAAKAHLTLTRESISLYSGSLNFQLAQVPAIHLANLTLTDQVFSVAPQDFLPPFNGRPIDGILGSDLLSQFAVRIDYPAHEITWITPGNLGDTEIAALGFTPQNLIVLGQERSVLDNVKINHYSLRGDFQKGSHTSMEDLIIDTGAPETLVSNTLAEALDLTPLSKEFITTLSEPRTQVNRSFVPKMQIGQTILSDVSVIAPQVKDSHLPSLLGESILSDCVVLFDFGPHRFYFKPVLPPAKPVSTVPLDKTQILWDRLRTAPDLPTVDEMLQDGFAPDVKDNLTDQAALLRVPSADSTKDVDRLEKLGVLLREGQDETGAKAAFKQAVTLAAVAAQAHPEDGVTARQWVQALMLADREDEAIAAATQTTVHLSNYAPGWRLLGSVLTSHVISILAGQKIDLTTEKVLKLMEQVPESEASPAQLKIVLPLLVNAHAAYDKSISLAPSDAEGYQERGLFRLTSRVALTAIQMADFKVTLPAPEVPSEDKARALAAADWQQCAALSANDIKTLSLTAYLDKNLSIFHDRAWLTAHLKGTGVALPIVLMSADTVQARLTLLTQDPDKTRAASAWTALGTVQAAKGEVSDITSEASWRQALTLDPAQSAALTALVSHLHDADRWTELRDCLTHQSTVSDSVPLRLTLAMILNAETLPADAEAQVRAAKVLSPNNAAVNLILADLLLARSSGDPAALSEAAVCLDKARLGYGNLATDEQKATLTTSQSAWLALDHDPDTAEKQLVTLAHEQPNCTQVREALAALVPY